MRTPEREIHAISQAVPDVAVRKGWNLCDLTVNVTVNGEERWTVYVLGPGEASTSEARMVNAPTRFRLNPIPQRPHGSITAESRAALIELIHQFFEAVL